MNDENIFYEAITPPISPKKHKLRKEPSLKIRNVNSLTRVTTFPSLTSFPVFDSSTQAPKSASASFGGYITRSPSMSPSTLPLKDTLSSLKNRKLRSSYEVLSSSQTRYNSMGFRSTRVSSSSSPRRLQREARIVESATLTVIGDPKVGKSSLILSYLKKRFTVPQNSDCFELYDKTMIFSDNLGIKLQIWDFPGTELFDRFRPLGYADTNAVIICFQIDHIESLTSVRDRWIPEVLKHCPTAKRIMVGIGSEARIDKTKRGNVLSYPYCLKFSNELDCEYFECSLIQSRSINIIFEKLAADLIRANKYYSELVNKERNKPLGIGLSCLEEQSRLCASGKTKRVSSYHRKKYNCIIS